MAPDWRLFPIRKATPWINTFCKRLHLSPAPSPLTHKTARDTRCVSLHPNIVLAVRSGVVEDRIRIPMLISRSQSPPEVKGATGVFARAAATRMGRKRDGRV